MSIFTLILLLFANCLVQEVHTIKDIPDPEALGYTVRRLDSLLGRLDTLRSLVRRNLPRRPGQLQGQRTAGHSGVFIAQTDDDNNPDRIPLRAIQLGVWVHKIGRDAADLLAIQYMDIYEPDLIDTTRRVYELIGERESQDSMIFRNHHSDDNEEEAYNLLHDSTPFGAGAQKMIDEFEEMRGKEVEAFGYDAQAPGVFDFTVCFWI